MRILYCFWKDKYLDLKPLVSNKLLKKIMKYYVLSRYVCKFTFNPIAATGLLTARLDIRASNLVRLKPYVNILWKKSHVLTRCEKSFRSFLEFSIEAKSFFELWSSCAGSRFIQFVVSGLELETGFHDVYNAVTED